MKIKGHRTHLGERHRVGGTVPDPPLIVPRSSPDAELTVVWYPHRNAPSLFQTLLEGHADYRQTRGVIALHGGTDPWSWFG